ncbi:MAG: putative sporulation protein YtxC [Maledivibacter sp.]|nr:putative sporulation protein YtxC [Maledivibacter sp.]
MDLLSITFYENEEVNSSVVDMITKNYNNKDMVVSNSTAKDGKFNTIRFYIDEKMVNKNDILYDDFFNVFKHYAAVGISNYIVDVLELSIIEKILQADYCFLKASEKKTIIEQLNICLDNEIYDDSIDVPYKVNRKAKIIYKLMDFFAENDSLNIEGFVNFRLRNYLDDIYEVIDRVVEEFVMEKEYNEFIKLLRYFVNIQESKIDLINIVVDKGGKYHFFDEKNKVIDDNYIRGLIDDLVDNNLNNDDFLVSSLITIAPKKIIFHLASNIKNTEIIETIKNIFDDRVYICNNCKICNINKDIKGE